MGPISESKLRNHKKKSSKNRLTQQFLGPIVLPFLSKLLLLQFLFLSYKVFLGFPKKSFRGHDAFLQLTILINLVGVYLCGTCKAELGVSW